MDAQAEEALSAALKAQPKLCDALSLQYSLARRRDAAALMDQLVKDFRGLPRRAGPRRRSTPRQRGDVATAAKIYAQLLAQDPGNVSTGATLANLYVSLRRYDEAAATLKELLRRVAAQHLLLQAAGGRARVRGRERRGAGAARAGAVLDGSDLSLRRAVVRAKTGKEMLQD